MKTYGLDQFDLRKVPEEEVVERLLHRLEERYPNVYKVLLEERNHYMVHRLQWSRANPGKKVLAFVGAGHKKGMEQLLAAEDTQAYSFSYSVG